MFEKPLGLRENPFLAGHHPKYLFPSREHQEALAHLRYGIQNREPFVLITGEVGTGKTTAVYDALAEWGSRAQVALITNSALTRSELLEEICLRFGVAVPSPMSKPQALVELQKQLTAVRERGELAILLVDEAQNLDRELLEEIRLLSNLEVNGEYLLQIFLVGQPELESKLSQKELRQLRQRIGIHYRILPLTDGETARYIHHRVSVAGGNAEELFPADTCVEIFRVTNGIPREINIVAGQSLLNAFVDDSRSVTIEHVRGVEREIEFQSVLRDQASVLRAPAQPVEPAPQAGAKPALEPSAPAAQGPIEVEPWNPPPPLEVVAHESAGEDVEVTESAFAEAPPDADEALVGEFPVRDEPPPTGEKEFTRETAELVLPSWIDEIVARRQTIEARATFSPPETPPTPLSPPVPTGDVLEPVPGFGRSSPSGPSGAMLVAPPPERIAPHPAEPIPLFDRPSDRHRLPPRLRGKLMEDEEDTPESAEGRKNSMLWPIVSLVIAAIAIGGLLVVRFGPWSMERFGLAPASAPAPAASPDTSLQSVGPFPPLDGLGATGVDTSTTPAPIGGQPPSATSPEPAPVSPGATPGASPASSASGGATESAAGTAPAASRSFGIAVGTYLNERRANAERTRLGESTTFPARVITVAEDTVSMYRVVVGSFGDRSSAERAASDMVQRGLVTEARVITIAQAAPPRP